MSKFHIEVESVDLDARLEHSDHVWALVVFAISRGPQSLEFPVFVSLRQPSAPDAVALAKHYAHAAFVQLAEQTASWKQSNDWIDSHSLPRN